jgi:beta-lactamase class A
MNMNSNVIALQARDEKNHWYTTSRRLLKNLMKNTLEDPQMTQKKNVMIDVVGSVAMNAEIMNDETKPMRL